MQIDKQFLYGKWTVVTVLTLLFSNFSRVLGARIMRTGIMRTYLRGTREKFTFFSVNTVTVQKNKIQIYRSYRCFQGFLTRTAHAHTVRVKNLLFHLYHLYVYSGWGWVEDDSQSPHAYRIRAVRVISLYFILHPPPPFTQCTTVSGTCVYRKKWAPPPFHSRILCI